MVDIAWMLLARGTDFFREAANEALRARTSCSYSQLWFTINM